MPSFAIMFVVANLQSAYKTKLYEFVTDCLDNQIGLKISTNVLLVMFILLDIAVIFHLTLELHIKFFISKHLV